MTLTVVGLAAAAGGLTGCSGASPAEGPLRITAAPAGPDTRLTLHAAPNLKINARVAPALELADHSVVRFESARLSADSAYFAEPPSALLRGRQAAVHGTLRASVCDAGAQVCRTVTVAL